MVVCPGWVKVCTGVERVSVWDRLAPAGADEHSPEDSGPRGEKTSVFLVLKCPYEREKCYDDSRMNSWFKHSPLYYFTCSITKRKSKMYLILWSL